MIRHIRPIPNDFTVGSAEVAKQWVAEQRQALMTVRDSVLERQHRYGRSVHPVDVEHVLVIMTASRGGSSLLYELMAATGRFVSLVGEHVPFYRLHGLDALTSPTSDDAWTQIDPGAADGLARTILSEARVGREASRDLSAFTDRTLLRLCLQAPELVPLMEKVRVTIHRLAARGPAFRGRQSFASDLIEKIRELRGFGDMDAVDPAYYYDLGRSGSVKNRGLAVGPPSLGYLFEEPPFTTPCGGRPVTPGDLETKPLLLKAPLDVYRPDVIGQLFPAARVKYLHLTRNPAASVNGLIDGWLDRGFYSHNTALLGACLDIRGYTNDQTWTRKWWNFDLPPGWRGFTQARLEDVCAFQWASAHRHVLDHLAGIDPQHVLRARFEDILHSPAHREDLIRRATANSVGGDWDGKSNSDRLPIIMATHPPSDGRWRARGDLLRRALQDDSVAEVAANLGYPTREMETWV